MNGEDDIQHLTDKYRTTDGIHKIKKLELTGKCNVSYLPVNELCQKNELCYNVYHTCREVN